MKAKHRILIKGATIVTLDEEGRVLRDSDLAIEGGRIVRLGEVEDDFVADEVLSGGRRVVMPGFYNAHTHAAMTLVRGWADDLPLDRWFNERIWVAESNLEEEDVYWGAALAVAEMIRSGTVGFADHYFFMDRVAQVVEQSGVRAALTWCVFGNAPESEIGTDLDGALAFAERWQGGAEGRIKTLLGPHSPYLCPPEFLSEVASRAVERGLGVHIHLSESEEQVANSLARYGLSPTAHLAELGLLEVPTIAAHCIHLAEGDAQILGEKGVSVVQCPNCHFKLGMGVTDVPRLQELGVNVALGTDGVASNNNLNMLEEARLANLMQKNHLRDPEVLGGDAVLRMATRNGARAMGFADCGVLAEGLAADLLVLDFDQPHLCPCHDPVSNLVHSAESSDITHVMVDGRWLMRERQLVTLDQERIMAEARQRASRMVGTPMSMVREYKG